VSVLVGPKIHLGMKREKKKIPKSRAKRYTITGEKRKIFCE